MVPRQHVQKTWELVVIYTVKARLIYRSTASGAVLKSKCDLIIQHPPF